MTRRRQLLRAAVICAAWPRTLKGQIPKRFRVACLWANDPDSIASLEKAFVDGLRELGYVAGRNLELHMRYARGDNSRLPALADELIRLEPEVVIGIESVAIVMRSKSKSIPIVLIASPNPVAAGLVKTLGRPGTNVTGMAYRFEELVAKHVDLLTEMVPGMSRVALVNYAAPAGDPGAQSVAAAEDAARAATARKGLTLLVVAVRDADSVRTAFADIERQRSEAVVVAATAATYRLREHIIGEARRLRLPMITSLPAEWTEAGGLVTYGPNWQKTYRYAATFVDRILKGAKPADMPIEQPSIEVVINLRTAREIGVSIPQSILVRADRILE
jgi:putative tryptophan/tyrosine transport system substrate-binding protein